VRIQFNSQAFLSLLYLCVSDIFALINYVGFATWVSVSHFFLFLYVRKISRLVEHRRGGFVFARFAVHSAEPEETDQSQPHLPLRLHHLQYFRHRRAHDR